MKRNRYGKMDISYLVLQLLVKYWKKMDIQIIS